MSLRVRHLLVATAFVLPACVVRLNDRNAPLESGGVTGSPVDCSTAKVAPRSTFGGDPTYRLVGRYDTSEAGKAVFDASGNWMEARFEGTRVAIGLEVPDFNKDVIFTVQIDDREPTQITASGKPLEPALKPQTVYVLANDLPQGEHYIRVHRDTEASAGGPVIFTGFDVSPGRFLPPPQRERRIEVIGDSITCGYGNMGANATCPFDIGTRPQVNPQDPSQPNLKENGEPEMVRVPVSENQYLAYSSIVGRQFDADVTTICWSGKGVSVNYRETGEDGKLLLDAYSLMPDLYNRTLLTDLDTKESPIELRAQPWDFTKEPEPQVVLVNLGTNDFTRDEEQPRPVNDGIDLPKFRAAYLAFVDRLRQLRPNAHIFLMIPPMVTDTFPLDNARTDFRNTLLSIVDEVSKRGDTKVHMVDLVEQGTRYGLGCDYHPNLRVHGIMAEQVAGAVQSKTCW